MRLALLAVLFGLAASGQARIPNTFVTTKAGRFLDGAGKPLVLRGLNVADKNPKTGYTQFTAADFDNMRALGANCIRLAVMWDALEPKPGKIDKAYLERVAGLVALAKARGIYVLLDMHQDLFSVKFSDGAPAWATLDEGKPHTQGKVWSDAYAMSEAVQTALDNFWANQPGPDGVGLQDHYAAAWRAVARRFAKEPAVVGYDLMNEPAPGAEYPRAVAAFLNEKADPSNLAQFSAAVDRVAPIAQAFERAKLQPFYQRVANAIRSADSRHILFVEPTILCNVGADSAVEPLLGRDGKPDPLQAWAPHVYDITTDRAAADNAAGARLAWMIGRQAGAARTRSMPLYIGEWGAYYLDAAAAPVARRHIDEFARHSASHAYWSYEPKLAAHPLGMAIRSPR